MQFEPREPDDPCPYLLSIWTPGKAIMLEPLFLYLMVILLMFTNWTGETAQSTEAPKTYCNSEESGRLCGSSTCFNCNNIQEMQFEKVRGTLLASSLWVTLTCRFELHILTKQKLIVWSNTSRYHAGQQWEEAFHSMAHIFKLMRWTLVF
jgi:hypothetical protein